MVWARDIYLFPIPNLTQSDNIIMFYKAKPIPLADLTKSLNVDDSFTEGIIAYVLWKAYAKEKEVELAAAQEQTYDKYIKQGLRWQKLQSGDQRYRLDIPSPIGIDGGTNIIYDPLN
jgi:trehalose-6-phosphate synthase